MPEELDYQDWLPDWAIGHNQTGDLVEGAQLCTRNGRRVGTAHIITVRKSKYVDELVYEGLTDAGSEFVYTAREIHGAYWIGQCISNPVEVLKRFGRPENQKPN